MSDATADNSFMWLFDSNDTMETSNSFLRVPAGTTPNFWFDSLFVWDWGIEEKVQVPTKGHLKLPRLKLRAGHRNHKLKNEYSGRRY